MRNLIGGTILLILMAPAVALGKTNQSALIDSEKGRVGDFYIGTKINEYAGYFDGFVPGGHVYSTINGDFKVLTNNDGLITEVQSKRRGMVTERFIRPGDSSLGDVLRSYGKPNKITSGTDSLTLDYGLQKFYFHLGTGWATGVNRSKLLEMKVESIGVKSSSTEPRD